LSPVREVTMSWLHCNTCFHMPKSGTGSKKQEPEEGQAKFFLSQCGRIHCELCLKPDGKCPRCGCPTLRVNKRNAARRQPVNTLLLMQNSPVTVETKMGV
jgi:hypothetical protein